MDDKLMHVVAIVVPILCTSFSGLLYLAFRQTLGRINDKIDSVQRELVEHKDDCGHVDKERLAAELQSCAQELRIIAPVVRRLDRAVSYIAGRLNMTIPKEGDTL